MNLRSNEGTQQLIPILFHGNKRSHSTFRFSPLVDTDFESGLDQIDREIFRIGMSCSNFPNAINHYVVYLVVFILTVKKYKLFENTVL